MTSTIFDKDTLLDLTVNIVPLAILAFFFVAFIVVNPWGSGFTLERVIQFILVGWVFVGLAVLTYAAAKRIETEDEQAGH
ncbi:DUF6684 family protein [Halobacterium bonnevillei]|uniref:Cox cluster protein n=1 Tax=Halobacterium bonnevillei TaxID=2692200 RepID=A0A6B0SJZ7_9EURY|nr:DUF6684 family protein [Halobacterium bonnevillei]MXR21995.1 hypothetical protein [Halobacterium bonnevillei]